MSKSAFRPAYLRGILLLGYAVILFTIACCSSMAASIAKTIPFKVTFEQSEPIIIPAAPLPAQAELNFPAPLADKQGVLCIKFRAYLNTNVPNGWATCLRFKLNDKSVAGVMPDGSERLLNRGRMLSITDGTVESWWSTDTLLAFFGNGSELDKRAASSRDEGFWYVLNISDIANLTKIGVDDRIEGGAPNHLLIENLGYTQSSSKDIVIKDLSVGYIPQTELTKLHAANLPALPSLKGKTIKAKGSSLVVATSGAMELKVGSDRYLFSSIYSYPADVIGSNLFSWEGKSSSEWKTKLTTSCKTKCVVSVKGEAKGYTVTRNITAKDGKYYIKDTIQNITDAPIGIIIKNQMQVPKPFEPGETNICGVSDARRTETCAANPTMFAKQSGSSLGIVCEDTLFRMQLVTDRIDNSIQFGTEHFGLAPNAKYTLEWTLYPSKAKEYFGFINRVRKDWNVNYTILGPAAFTKRFVPGRDMNLYIMQPWFLYSNGSALSPEEFKKVQQAQIASVLALQPNAKPIGLIETNLVTLKRSDIKGGEIIPTTETYGLELTPEQAEVFKDSPWNDSMIKTADGRPYLDTYYARPPFLDLMVYPALGNHQLKYMKYQIDYLMDEVGFKGIYLDQFELASTVTGMGRADYSKWDGHTVDIDSQGNIVRKYTDATYVGTPARLEIIKYVQSKGGILVTNGHSYARETNGVGVMTFSETEWDVNTAEEILNWNEPPALPSIAEAHLDSPIGLGIRPNRFGKFGDDHFAEITHKWVITFPEKRYSLLLLSGLNTRFWPRCRRVWRIKSYVPVHSC